MVEIFQQSRDVYFDKANAQYDALLNVVHTRADFINIQPCFERAVVRKTQLPGRFREP